MNKTNVFSAFLVLLFMISCLTFFSVSATVDENDPDANPTASVTEPKPTTQPKTSATTAKPTTVATTTAAETTTAATTPKNTVTTKKTKVVTAADPVYTSKATTAATAAKTTTKQAAEVTAATTQAIGTKETKEIHSTEKTTEPTTAAKNIVDYGNKYRPLKWLSLIVMIGCIAALIAVNVRYRKKYGKTPPKKPQGAKGGAKKKPQLDTSARFDSPKKPADSSRKASYEDDNLDKTTVVDLSSFSKKSNADEFKPKADDDYFGETKRKDEDNLYSSKKSEDDDLYI